jgi:opacity protein-like surface antigen
MKSFAVIILAICIAATSADAQYYFEGNTGVSVLKDADIDSGGTPFIGRFDKGYILTGALGYSMDSFRLEGEISYRKNNWDEVEDSSGFFAKTAGYFSAITIMANAWRDFNIKPNWNMFVGGGVGLSQMNMEITQVGLVATAGDFSDNVFAYQAGVGVSYQWLPKTNLVVQYRLFGTEQVDFSDDGGDKYDYLSHSLMLGIRRAF